MFTKQEAIDKVEDTSCCPRCRYLAAGYILRGYWKNIDASTISKADRIRWNKEKINQIIFVLRVVFLLVM